VGLFSQIKVTGHLDVNLRSGFKKPILILKGDPRDLAKLSTINDNGFLKIQLDNTAPRFGPVSMEIRAGHLSSFEYRGSGSIKGMHLNSNALDLFINNSGRTVLGGNINVRTLKIKGSGYTEIQGIYGYSSAIILSGRSRVQLTGVANLTNIDMSGESWLSMHWVKSYNLKIRARDHTLIQLAGIAEKMDVELWGYAHFNGRFLRVKNIFAKTHDRSLAEITSTNKQHTLATDASDIYFYPAPKMKTDFMAYDGAVLRF
jgi:hypothetical protein